MNKVLCKCPKGSALRPINITKDKVIACIKLRLRLLCCSVPAHTRDLQPFVVIKIERQVLLVRQESCCQPGFKLEQL